MSVCVSVSEQNCTDLDAVFAKSMYAYRTGSDPIEIGDLGSKVKVTVTLNPFFFVLTSLHVSQLSYVQSKWNSVCP